MNIETAKQNATNKLINGTICRHINTMPYFGQTEHNGSNWADCFYAIHLQFKLTRKERR